MCYRYIRTNISAHISFVNIPEPVQYHIFAMAFPFDLRYESVTHRHAHTHTDTHTHTHTHTHTQKTHTQHTHNIHNTHTQHTHTTHSHTQTHTYI